MALNSVKGYAVITEQASGTLQLIDLRGSQPVQSGGPVLIASGAQPTDITIDDQLQINGGDLATVVDSGAGRLYFFSVSTAGITPANIVGGTSNFLQVDLNSVLGQSGNTAAPHAFGVDATSHLGVLAYTGTSLGTNIAFIVDINPNDASSNRPCFSSATAPKPCVISPVTVVTGPTPRVVMQPGVPLAYITPGGANGASSVVDLLQTATSVFILPAATSNTATGAFRASGITTIKTITPHGINATLGGTVIISGLKGSKDDSTKGISFNGTYIATVVDPYTFSYPQTGLPDDQETNTSSSEGTVQYGSPYYSFSTSANVSGAAINPVTRTFAYADFASYAAQIGFISTLDQTLTSLSLTAGSCNGCTPSPTGGPENGFRSVAWDPFTDVLIAYNPSKNPPSGNLPSTNAVSLINPGGPAPSGLSNSAYRIIAAIPTNQIGQGSYTPSGGSTAVNVYGPMAYDPKSKFVLVVGAGDNTLNYMNLDPSGTFQKVHIQTLEVPNTGCSQNPSACYAVPIAQPKLGNPPITTCSSADPLSPCMPQGVQVGKPAAIQLFGQGFSSVSGVSVRLDGQTAITPPGATSPVPITSTVISDSEIDLTIPAAVLFAPHDYAIDVQYTDNAQTQTSNAVQLHVVGLLDMSGVCTPTSVLPQGPEGVSIDQARHIAVITNYACNSASVINLDMTGTLYPGMHFGQVLGTVGVGKQPIGVGIISRLGQAVVANNGDSPTGTASIIDISDPRNPKLVSWSVTGSGSTTTSSAVTVGLSPLGVSIDQDRALALIANAGSNTLSAIDLTVLFPSVSGGHTQSAPVATTIGLSGPPTAVAVDPNRAFAAVTNLQNAGTTAVIGGLDVINLATTPPSRSTSSSVSSLTVNPTGIVYDPGDPNQSNPVKGLFYVTSTQQNAVYAFNPDTGSSQTIRVGVNPYSVGFNYQTGTLLSINSTSNTSSVIDSQNFKTRETLGISSLSQFAIDVDQFENMAVIVDQNNNRVVFLALPR
jgi:DNA-binding beta-propeller fold protein YncE